MLEIFANGIKLILPDDISLNLVIENPLFQADKIPVPYSLNFEIPLKPNLTTFKHPNRVTSFVKEEFPAEARFNSISIFKGIIEIVNVTNTISLSMKGVDMFNDFKAKLFDIDMGVFNIGKLTYLAAPINGSLRKQHLDRDDPSNIAGKYRKIFNDSVNFANNTAFYCAPIKVGPSQDWVGVGGPSVLPSSTADKNYINFYNCRQSEFNIVGNWIYRPNAGGAQIYQFASNTRAFPFPYIGKIINFFFNNLIISHPFNTGELAKLVLITSYHPNWAPITGYVQDLIMEGMLVDDVWPEGSTNDFVITIKKYMPDVAVVDLLKQVLKLFCATLVPIGGKFKILLNKDVINSVGLESWSHKLVGEYQLSIRGKQAYKYEYSSIKDENISGLVVKDLSTIQDLLAYVINETDVFEQYFKVQSSGEVYKKKRIGANDYQYQRMVTGLGGSFGESKDAFDVSTEISPLPMGIFKAFDEAKITPSTQVPDTYPWYVPEINPDRTNRNSDLYIMFARGMVNVPGKSTTYPLLSANDKGIAGETLGQYSLRWDGENGLINQFHSEFKDWIEKDKVKLSGSFFLDAIDIKNLDLLSKKNIKGRNFLIEKVEVSVSKDKINHALIDFIEA